MDWILASYLDFINYAYPTLISNTGAMWDGKQGKLEDIDSDTGAILSVGVEKAIKVGFQNNYLNRTLNLTMRQLDELIDYIDAGRLTAENPDVDSEKAKEVLLWLKSILERS